MKNILKGAFGFDNTVAPEVYELFKGMLTSNEKEVPYALEIIKAANEGRISMDGSFCLEAYCGKIKSNLEKNAIQRAKKVTFLDMSANPEEDMEKGVAGAGFGVSVNKIVKMESSYEEIDEDEDLVYAIKQIKRVQEDILAEEGIDLLFLMKRAASGVPQAVQKLRQFCEEYELLAEQVKIILTSGRPLDTLCVN